MKFKFPKQIVIGLTGGMLSGKSTVLDLFEKRGAFVLSCDALVREISLRAEVKKKIEKIFGSSERQFLTQKIFNSPRARTQLENLLHPLVIQELSKRLKANKTFLRVVEVPLLFEAQLGDYFDLTLSVSAPERVLLKRLSARSIKKEDFEKRSIAQFSQEKKMALADISLINGGSLAQLEEKVENIYQAILKIYQVK